MLAFLPGGVGPMELMVFGTIALLLFGKRLPEVARSLGKGIVEFKRGIKGVEDEFRGAANPRYDSPPPRRRPDPVDEAPREISAPKFEPPTSAPTASGDSQSD